MHRRVVDTALVEVDRPPVVGELAVVRRLVVVRVDTDQDGLYGYGCATYTQRADLVVAAVERYLKPFLEGRPTDGIEDLWGQEYADLVALA